MPTQQQSCLGKQGEDLACRELRRRGYAILARGYRTRYGEIDIIARDGDTLVFVEVKTRSSDQFGTPLEAVTRAKQQRIIAMAQSYLVRRQGREVACRFDVVCVRLGEGARPDVALVRNAFGARGG